MYRDSNIHVSLRCITCTQFRQVHLRGAWSRIDRPLVWACMTDLTVGAYLLSLLYCETCDKNDRAPLHRSLACVKKARLLLSLVGRQSR